MKLPGMFMSSEERFVESDSESLSLYLNSAVLTCQDLAEIQQWCLTNHCHYYTIGYVKFPDESMMTAFLLRWS